jgi:hypothetical protein
MATSRRTGLVCGPRSAKEDDTVTLTVQECTQQINVVPHSIRKWIWAGKLPAKKIPKGREQWTYLVNAEDWQAFVEDRQNGRLSERGGDVIPGSVPQPTRPSQHLAYFPTNDPADREVQQVALMKRAMQGCRASREALREEPYRLIYWMAVDGAK